MRRRHAAHAGDAQDSRRNVVAGRSLPNDDPSEEGDDHAVERGEKRAVGGGGVGESRGVEPVGEE